MKTKHTKGEWQIFWCNYTHFATINKDVTTRICTIDVGRDGLAPIEEATANAKLIATAPELLIVLDEMEKAAIALADAAPVEYKNQRNELFANVHNAHLYAVEAIKKATK